MRESQNWKKNREIKLKTILATSCIVLMNLTVFSQWDTSNTPKIFYNSGNVGIGLTNPNFSLAVNSVENQTVLGGNTKSVIRIMNGYASWFNRRAELQFGLGQASNEILWVIAGEYSSWNGNIGGDLVFGTTPTSTTAVLERMRINRDGKVGIGNNTPNSMLTIGSLTGAMTSTSGISLGADQNQIEFLNSTFGYGYGAKLYGLDQGNGLTSFRIAVRGNSQSWSDALFIKAGDNSDGGGNLGFIGIGTSTPDERLTVNGTVHAKEVRVDTQIGNGPDYVFEPNYKLLSLEEIKSFIDQHKHLPEVPSASRYVSGEMETNGVNVSEMNMLLLKKIEELTLYVIEQRSEINDLKSEIRKLKIKSTEY